MKRIALVTSCLLASLAAEAQIYQYKDASGRTVFSDVPPSGGATKSRQVSSEAAGSGSAATPAAAAPKSTVDRELEFKKRQKEQQEAATKSEKEAANKAARQEDCSRAKRSLDALESGQRITTYNNGERNFLDDDQRAAETERMRKAVAELCK